MKIYMEKDVIKLQNMLLLRIDMERLEMLQKRVRLSGNITVENILPRTPNQYWKNKFSEKIE